MLEKAKEKAKKIWDENKGEIILWGIIAIATTAYGLASYNAGYMDGVLAERYAAKNIGFFTNEIGEKFIRINGLLFKKS